MYRLQDDRFEHRADHEGTLRLTPAFSERGAFLGLSGAF
jgi:hypothetical protein